MVSILDEKTYSLSYMVKQQNGLYTWPVGDEVCFVHPASDIITKLADPQMLFIGSRLFSNFDLTNARSLFEE